MPTMLGSPPQATTPPPGQLTPDSPLALGLHLTTDLLIAISYFAISATLLYLVWRARKSLPFNWVFVAFGVFIVACGTTHLFHIINLLDPRSWWLLGSAQVITVVASVTTALMLPPLTPRVLGVIEAARASEERRRQIERANQELIALSKQLRELDDLKARFFANVSHELRTPLSLILGPARHLRDDASLPDAVHQDLAVIERNARTLLKHVDDLLDVARLEAGRLTLAAAPVDLAELTRLAASHFEALAREKRIAFTVETPTRLVVQADAEKLSRVIVNLLSNAFKFTPEGGAIQCEVAVEGDQITLTVWDTGPGVPAAMREAIFERFRQVDDSATRQVGGVGLGLTITREFVTLHDGAIALDDAPGGGARFRCRLPLVPAEDQEPASLARSLPPVEPRIETATQTPAATDPPPSRLNETDDRPSVLVVEDHPDMRAFITRILAAEHRTVAATDGQAGLDLLADWRPDLIVTDIMMPRLSGNQLVAAVRARADLAATPILLLSARADDGTRARLLRDGAQDYLVKPFAPEELRARAGNLIAAKRAGDALRRALDDQRDDLAEMAEEVARRKREAEAASQAKEVFLATAAHELKTPIAIVKGYAQFQEQRARAGQPTDSKSLAIINQQCDRLTMLVRDLLEVSRLALGRVEWRLQRLDLTCLAGDVVASLRPLAPAHTFYLEANEPAIVRADRERLEQVFINLLSNAIKFSPNGGRIETRVVTEADQALVSVRDEGIGIPADHQERVFERFHRAHADTEHDYGGMGIGLHLCREIVTRHGGSIWFESAAGRGSTFYFRLPLDKEQPDV